MTSQPSTLNPFRSRVVWRWQPQDPGSCEMERVRFVTLRGRKGLGFKVWNLGFWLPNTLSRVYSSRVPGSKPSCTNPEGTKEISLIQSSVYYLLEPNLLVSGLCEPLSPTNTSTAASPQPQSLKSTLFKPKPETLNPKP